MDHNRAASARSEDSSAVPLEPLPAGAVLLGLSASSALVPDVAPREYSVMVSATNGAVAGTPDSDLMSMALAIAVPIAAFPDSWDATVVFSIPEGWAAMPQTISRGRAVYRFVYSGAPVSAGTFTACWFTLLTTADPSTGPHHGHVTLSSPQASGVAVTGIAF